MDIVLLILIFMIGITWGSFLNVWIYRIPNGGNIAKGRSYCPYCRHTLSPLDLVPLFSYLFLRGKCRYCKCRIPWRYPLVEFITGALFVSTFLIFPESPYAMLKAFLVITFVITAGGIVYQEGFVPGKLFYPFIAIMLGLAFYELIKDPSKAFSYWLAIMGMTGVLYLAYSHDRATGMLMTFAIAVIGIWTLAALTIGLILYYPAGVLLKKRTNKIFFSSLNKLTTAIGILIVFFIKQCYF